MEKAEKYYPFELNDEQKELVKRLLDFIDSDDDIFILKGYAGTGKTTIMHGLVKYFVEKNRPFSLMASTGRAAKVMAEKARFPSSTIHSSIYVLHIVEMPKKGKSKEEETYRISFKLKMPDYNGKVVYFIDESSMITNHLQSGANIAFGTGRLMDDLFRFVGNGKVVFIGDPAQLPPVNSKFSAALNKEFLESSFSFKVNDFELKKIMRYSADSGIFFNTNLLRERIVSNRFPPLSIKVADFSDIEVSYYDNELVMKYYQVIKKYGVDSAIYITLSNMQASIVNRKVRNHLWGHKNINLLKPGESLMVIRNNQLYGLSNGDLVKVNSIEHKVEIIAGLAFKYITIHVADPDPLKGMVVKRVLINIDLLSLNSRDLSAQQDMNLLKNYFSRMRKIAIEIYVLLNSTTDIEKRRFELISIVKRLGISLDINDIVGNLPSKEVLTKSIAYENMQTDPYLNALRVKYGYAITCHKAQGSEWQQVFIHLEKSMFYLDKENQHRWAYTAMSRAEKKIHLLNNICLY